MLDSLTLAQRVGQLFLVGVDGNVAGPGLTAAEHAYHFGSLLLNKTSAGTAALAAQTAVMQELAPSGAGGVRFFIAANQEGGQIQQLSGPGFATMPSELTQGSLPRHAAHGGDELGDATCARRASTSTSRRSWTWSRRGARRATRRSGRLTGSSASTRRSTARTATAFIQGMAAAGVMTVAKHFPGLGRVAGNTDFTPNVVDNVTTAGDPYLDSFRDAVGAGVPMVMVALATYTRIDPAQLAVFSPAVMRLLRGRARLHRGHHLR